MFSKCAESFREFQVSRFGAVVQILWFGPEAVFFKFTRSSRGLADGGAGFRGGLWGIGAAFWVLGPRPSVPQIGRVGALVDCLWEAGPFVRWCLVVASLLGLGSRERNYAGLGILSLGRQRHLSHPAFVDLHVKSYCIRGPGVDWSSNSVVQWTCMCV